MRENGCTSPTALGMGGDGMDGEECEWLRSEVHDEIRRLNRRIDRLMSNIIWLVVFTALAFMAGGLVVGMVAQEVRDCDVVNDSILNETYYEGYRDGYVAAVQDLANNDLASIVCELNETITINIDGREFKLVCEG